MTSPRLLLVAVGALVPLGLGDARPAVVLPVACLAALLAIGELWLRALTAEAVAPAARLGLGVAAGLVTLPLVAIVLHVLGVAIRARSLAVALAVVALLVGVVAVMRSPDAGPRFAGTAAAAAIPLVVMLIIGGAATFAYVRLPHPPQPAFTSVALGGWAAGIDGPVTFPRSGLDVALRVSSAGRPAGTAPLWIQVGDRVGPSRPVPLPVDGTGSVAVHVPAPPDGCLHRIEISLGPASTVFYGRGPYAPRRAATC